MADLSKTIEIIFDGVDNTASAFGAVISDLDSLAGSVESATQPVADLTSNLLLAETAALAVGAAFATVAAQAAGEFNDAFSEISTLVNATDEDLDRFKDDLQAYAASSTQSFEDITQATYNAISAGIDYEDAIDALAVAEELAVASKTDLNTAMQALVPTLNAYGAGMEEAADYSDILFTAVKEGKTTLPELESALGNVTPTAAAMGVPLEEVAAALATLTANGLSTEQAATALNSSLNSILKPSKEAATAADALGVNLGATALETEGLDGWLRNLVESTGGNVDEMALLVGGSESLKAILSLTSSESEVFNSKLEAMSERTGATAEAFGKMADSFELTNQQLQNAVDNMLIEAGDPLLAGWEEIANSLTEIFLSLGDSIDEGAFDDIYAMLDQFAIDISAALDEIAANLPEALEGVDWSGFTEAMEELAQAVSDIFGGADLTTAEGLENAIQAVVDVGAGLITTTASIIDTFGPLFDVLGEAISWFNSLDSETQAAIGTFMGVSTATNVVVGAMSPLFTAVSGVADVFGALAKSNLASVLTGINSSATPLSSTMTVLGKSVAAVGAAYAGWEAGKWIADVTGLDDAAAALGEAWAEAGYETEQAAGNMDIMSEHLADISERTGISVDSMEDFNAAVEAGTLVWDDTINQWVRAGEETDALAQAQREANDAMVAQSDAALAINEAMVDITDSLGLAADGSKTFVEEQSGVVDSMGGVSGAVYDAEGNLIGYEQAAGSAADATGAMADAAAQSAGDLELSAEKAAEMELAWAELASQERSLMFQAAADIKTPQIEADAQTIVASMEMMSAAFESTGEVLGDLFGLWMDVDSLADQSQIEEWIEREYEMREQLAEAQIALVEAEIAKMEAQTAMLEQGGVELKITSDGLEPELEAFMFRVIDKVRVSIAGSYEQFLIGAGCEAA